MTTTDARQNDVPPLNPRPEPTGPLRLAMRAVQVRIRFALILAFAFLVASQWETVRNFGDRWTRSVWGVRGLDQAVSPDTEYFCPMDPGVVAEWPGKCGICNMSLVRRKSGEATPLPDGVVARMQFSPYRVQLAGLRTAPVVYEALGRETTLVGSVTAVGPRNVIEAELFERDRPYVAEGQAVEAIPMDSEATNPLAGKVMKLSPGEGGRRMTVRVEVDDPDGLLRPGVAARLRVVKPVAEMEPFRSSPDKPSPVRTGDVRAVYRCPVHPEVLGMQRGSCPVDGKDELERQALLDNQRLAWWCPMHPKVTAERAGAECTQCGSMKLVPRVVTFRPPGRVLTVPESAVVDTGMRSLVYVERMPGMFDGVEVTLGPRCGDTYPVIKGLEAGQRVATTGAFLVDAETRLNPGLAAAYFGSRRSERATGEARLSGDPSPRLSTEDQAVVTRQKVCPVTRKPLGSMGTPVKLLVAGRSVMICCGGCESALRKDPAKYLPGLP